MTECGNKCSTSGEQAAKRYVPPIERKESSSRDVVIKEMVGDDSPIFVKCAKNVIFTFKGDSTSFSLLVFDHHYQCC